MYKYLAMFLTTHLATTTIIASPLINNDVVKNLVTNLSTNRAYYKNIDTNFSNYNADVHQAYAGSNNSSTGGTGTIFNWNDYANSWDEFKNNYNGLNLTVTMDIAFNWYNVKWSTASLYIPLSNITVGGTNWIQIHEEVQTTTQWSRWDACHAGLYYDCWVSGNSVVIRFQLKTWATNNYDNYYYSIDTRKLTCNSTFNYNTIKDKLNQYVNNQSLSSLQSDYSTSLQDSRNWPLINQSIKQLVQTALGSYYDAWKDIIFPVNDINTWAYQDATNQVTLTVDFNDPNSNAPIRWIFTINVTLTLSGNYWTKTLKDRLEITPGQVINPNDPNGSMITDVPLIQGDKSIYSTTAYVRFTGAPDDSETMKVNGQDIQVINHQSTFNMTDQQKHTDDKGKPTNEYDILLEKHDLKDWNHILGHYEVKYVIKQNIPNLQLKWHAWNPDKNYDQYLLIHPTIDGKANDKYDKEVNKDTGTKTQIIWVKHLAENPFPLDPLNQNGERTLDAHDPGFIAEAAVSGMGIEQTFNDPWIKSVTREQVNPHDLTSISSQTQISSDDQGQYFSSSGTYHYTITDQKGFTANKFITIGQDYQNKYAKFLDVLNNPSVAVNFWISMEGVHLKYYLISQKHLDSKAIQDLNFEQVTSYWKEYVSDVRSQNIPIPPTPGNLINLDTIQLENIKMHASDIKTIKNNIINGYHDPKFSDVKGVVIQLKSYGLDNDVDYQINDLDDTNLNQLFNFDSNGNASIVITINALPTSTKASGSTKITIINCKESLENAVDLSKVGFDNLVYNYNSFTSSQLKTWVLDYVTKVLTHYPYIDKDKHEVILIYQTDYGIEPFNDATLQKFLHSKTKTSLILTIKSLDTNRAIHNTTLTLVNDPTAPPVPPDPPDPKPPIPPNPPIPTPDPSGWFGQGQNLAWFIPLVVMGSGGMFFSIWWLKIRKSNKIK